MIILYLVFIAFLGLLLRLINFDSIYFSWDQARDALASLEIWQGDPIKIMGPNTDIIGLFHGPLYWYLISPFYYLGNHDPVYARIVLILLNLVNVFFIFFFTQKLFKNIFIALISAFIFSISFEATQYARWLSNPAPAILTVALFYYGFWLSLEKKRIGLPIMFLSLGISMQFQLFLVYLSVFLIPAFLSLYVKNMKRFFYFRKEEIILYVFSLFSISTFILAEVKFKFQGVRSFLAFFNPAGKHDNVFKFGADKFTNNLISNIDNTFTSEHSFLSLMILLCFVSLIIYVWVKRDPYRKHITFLFIWLISPLLIYPVEKNNSYYLNIGTIYPLIILFSLALYKITHKLKALKNVAVLLILFTILVGNIRLIWKYSKNGEVLFEVQQNMLLTNEKKVLDYIYQQSDKKDFYVNTVSNPLFIATTWSYLFNWYGKSKYGYMPIWYGYPQDGVYGSGIKYKSITEPVDKSLFLIIEPNGGIPTYYVKAFSDFEDLRSTLVERKKIGAFIVEKRLIKNTMHFSRDDLTKLIIKN